MSQSGSTLADWLVRLESFSPHEIELGLERVLDVIEQLDLSLPEPIFHVAGTNGKGSSVAFAQALLSEPGSIVGTYTSPHVLEFNERICIDAEPASSAEIIAVTARNGISASSVSGFSSIQESAWSVRRSSGTSSHRTTWFLPFRLAT